MRGEEEKMEGKQPTCLEDPRASLLEVGGSESYGSRRRRSQSCRPGEKVATLTTSPGHTRLGLPWVNLQTDKGCLAVSYFSKPGWRLLPTEEEVVVALWVVGGVGGCI